MDVLNVVDWIAAAAEKNPVLLIALLLGIGSLVGRIRVKGTGLGPAAVLFTALTFSALNPALVLPPIIGTFGLALFAYTLGLSAGPSFFALLRRGSKVIVYTSGVLVVAGIVVLVASEAFGLDRGLAAGIYAGALTNTPALAAASEQVAGEGPVVGYSLTYLYGVIGMMAMASLALRGREDTAADDGLVSRDVRVEVADLPDLEAMADRYGSHVRFSRIMRGDSPGHSGDQGIASPAAVPQPGDILTVVGPAATVDQVVADVGHLSTVHPTTDRGQLDYRRLLVSESSLSGMRIGDLRLERRFGATVTRVRRGDVDLLATDDLQLLPGDRVRVVAPTSQMAELAKLFGDSEASASTVNAAGLGIGLSLGVMLGLLVWPIPGGAGFSLGVAGGSLLTGLVLGRKAKTGPIVWSLPYAVSSALGQLGMLLFLAYAGSTAGPALVSAFDDEQVWIVLAIGVVLTTAVGLSLVFLGRSVGKMAGPMTAGTIAGAATQPAVLAHANASSGSPTVNVGYALVYPAAMIVKVIVAPLVGTLLL